MIDSDIIIRTADRADAADIAALGARTFLQAFAAETRPAEIDAYVAAAFSVGTIEDELRDPKSVFFLATRDDIGVGYCKLRDRKVPGCVDGRNPIELERIYVDSKHQGSGIGAMLMQAVIEFAHSQDCRAIWLGTWEKNAGARRFYEKHGFVRVGSKYFMVGNEWQNDVVMRRILD